MPELIERVLYEESIRTIDGQRELLEGVRARAGTLLATAFVATAFFGTQTLDRRPLGGLGWSAIALFLLVVVSTLMVLTPWRLQLTHHPHSLIDYHLETAPISSLADVYSDLAYWNGVNYDENGRKLEALVVVLGVACASLGCRGSRLVDRPRRSVTMTPKPKPPLKPNTGTYETRKPKR